MTEEERRRIIADLQAAWDSYARAQFIADDARRAVGRAITRARSQGAVDLLIANALGFENTWSVRHWVMPYNPGRAMFRARLKQRIKL